MYDNTVPVAVLWVWSHHWSSRSCISSSPLVMTLTLLIMCTTSPEKGEGLQSCVVESNGCSRPWLLALTLPALAHASIPPSLSPESLAGPEGCTLWMKVVERLKVSTGSGPSLEPCTWRKHSLSLHTTPPHWYNVSLRNLILHVLGVGMELGWGGFVRAKLDMIRIPFSFHLFRLPFPSLIPMFPLPPVGIYCERLSWTMYSS